MAGLVEKRQVTRVLPIVGLDVGAIGSSSLFGFGSGWTFAIWLFVFIFIKCFLIELRLPGGGFSNPPPSAILVR
jgi:hypothetical protein